MARTESRQDALEERVQERLKGLRSKTQLKDLFHDLKYDCVDSPISPRPWADSAAKKLAEDPVVLATGGQHNDFEVIYSRLNSSELLHGHERPIVSQFLRCHPNSCLSGRTFF